MEGNCSTKRSHKEWRKAAKKERRRRLRRKAAAEREADEQRLRAALEKSAAYLIWLEQREAEENVNQTREREEHDQLEKLWLEEEVRAQEEWQILQERKQRARQLQLEQEAKIRQEFETKQEAIRKKQEEDKRKRDEEIRKREELLKEIDDYIDSGIKTPEALREVIESQPGKELCPFFTKTGACRYGDTCSRNHRRVCLSKVILVPGFYTHFSLEKNSAEYDTDIALEFESSETRQHFREFYKDVVPELESLGRIRTLKYCCNTEVHLRGNLYVEYHTEREAARALRRLKGRWYAGRQLNCEFVNLKSWRSAVCGMSKCPKGRACNFLHTFKNPRDEYDIKSPPRRTKQFASHGSTQEMTSSRKSEYRNKSKWDDGSDAEEIKNWRWSESPEPEMEHRSRNTDKRRRCSDDRDSRQKSGRDKRPLQSDRERIADNGETSVRRRRQSSKKHSDEKTKNDSASNGCESSKGRSKTYHRKREENDDHGTPPKHPRKGHSRSNDRSCRSKTCRSSSKYPRREKEEDERAKRKWRTRNESTEDFTRIDDQEVEGATNVSPMKTKWDKENTEQVDPEKGRFSHSELPVEIQNKEMLVTSLRTSDKGMSEDDEWATTDSDSETKMQEQ